MRHLALLLALALAVACSSAPAPTRCTPGASVACVCPGVGTGAQVCAADGASYGACACGVDAGGDTGTGMDVIDAGGGCTPGTSAACVCGGSGQGTVLCQASREFGACVCDAGVRADAPDVVDVPRPTDVDPRCVAAGAASTWCPSGAGACVDLQTDTANCGACGRRCGPLLTECFGGSCFLPLDASVDAAR